MFCAHATCLLIVHSDVSGHRIENPTSEDCDNSGPKLARHVHEARLADSDGSTGQSCLSSACTGNRMARPHAINALAKSEHWTIPTHSTRVLHRLASDGSRFLRNSNAKSCGHGSAAVKAESLGLSSAGVAGFAALQ